MFLRKLDFLEENYLLAYTYTIVRILGKNFEPVALQA